MTSRFIFSFCLVGVLLLGCERQNDETVSVSQGDEKSTKQEVRCGGEASKSHVSQWDELPDEAVVATWRDVKLTRGDFRNHVKLMTALIRNRRPKISDEKLKGMVARRLPQVKDELISRMMLMKGLILTNDEAELERTREMIKSQYSLRLCRKSQNFDDLCSSMKENGVGDLFMQRFDQDVLIETAFDTTYRQRVHVTEMEYSNTLNRVTAYNLMAKATNDLNWASATNVLKRLAAGESFEKLADEMSQDPEKEPGGDMGECDPASLRFGDCSTEDFAKTPYWQEISNLKDGEHTGILETDVGLEIIKRTAYVSATNSNSGVPALRLSRIYFRKPYIYEEQDERDFRADLKIEKREMFIEEFFKEIQEKDKVSYPLGENIFPKDKMRPSSLPKPTR